MSCKEVSLYLLSLELQDVNRRNCGQSSENTQLTYKVACGTVSISYLFSCFLSSSSQNCGQSSENTQLTYKVACVEL